VNNDSSAGTGESSSAPEEGQPEPTSYTPPHPYAYSQPYRVPVETVPSQHKRSKPWLILLLVLLLGAGAVYAFNYLRLQDPLKMVIKGDSRNAGIDVSVRYQNFVDLSTLVYDLQSVSPTNSEADVFRVFLQYAEMVRDQNFNAVDLAYKGKTKYIIEGNYFHQLGTEYSWQNPVYTMRTFPENVLRPSGEHAYSQWTGGILGVTNAQMNDFDDFQKQWYLNDMIAGR